MSNVTLEMGYNSTLLVPAANLPMLVDILNQCKTISGYPEKKTSPVEYSIKATDPDLDKQMTEREKSLEKKAKEDSDRWYKAYQENEQLKKDAVVRCKEKEEFETSPEYLAYLSRRLKETSPTQEPSSTQEDEELPF